MRVRRKNPDVRCICGILLESRFGGKNRTKYCDGCAGALKRTLNNLYQRRAYARKVGKEQEAINERNITTRRRPVVTEGRIFEYMMLKEGGLSYHDIGQYYGVCKQSVHKVITRGDMPAGKRKL